MKHLIAPSLLSANFANLEGDINMLNKSEADWFHLDVMDGVFVPNISFGIPVIKAIKKLADKPLDVHLMIVQPERYISAFKAAGADILTIHMEASTHLHRSIAEIKTEGMKAGVVLNPHTPISTLTDIISDLDMVLLMSVNPGFGGQKFIENTYRKISRLKDLIIKSDANTLIEIDGGVNLNNAPKLIETGADVLVAGNTIFSSENPSQTIKTLKDL
ncbi:MAG: ribulose-phosphate 3-epimerase [Lentimicrobiaceae bacterium]|jgi:ribulose-phosphate 3-epimerase|nr:ribulose-phosphate 3-epimerase [Lentimicrobiaceae bacterium]MBT3453553.1 ribulose-phosphate 3-epimerase [Lentimicrobiaceae bacterium]MBT3818894.1 ribulose-phosphate 3-epimerase [Lentimicrobiaceae bacterium]MBT4060417.1 ribulose-phosphate 3-epimerase [Lentimicrobiaceae bacterium]MBT4191631.1 ribulose-phosphate 3-epimerase [Lentimicrobiaceae bacterium]